MVEWSGGGRTTSCAEDPVGGLEGVCAEEETIEGGGQATLAGTPAAQDGDSAATLSRRTR